MKKKKILAAALAAAMVVAMPLTVSASWSQDATGNWSWNEDGTKATGWKQVGSTWYYFNADGVMQTGWQKLNGNWFFLKPSGAMATGWEKVDGKWYFMKDWGGMATGWVKTGDKWYHMQPSGEMSTGKVEVNGATYFLGDADDGALKTGFITEGDKTYFSSEYGVQTGVVEVDGDVYYFDEEDGGAMATGAVEIDGKTYNFNEDGACTSRTKPEAEVAFQTTTTDGGASTVAPVTPGTSTGDNGGSTGGDTGDTGSTGGGSTGGSDSGSTTPEINAVLVTKVTPVEHDGAGVEGTVGSNVGKYTVSANGNTITLKATDQLVKHQSTGFDTSHEHQWMGFVISTNVPIEALKVNGGAQTADDAVLQGVNDGHSFVMWIAADRTTNGDCSFDEPGTFTRTIKLSAKGYAETDVTINFENQDLTVNATAASSVNAGKYTVTQDGDVVTITKTAALENVTSGPSNNNKVGPFVGVKLTFNYDVNGQIVLKREGKADINFGAEDAAEAGADNAVMFWPELTDAKLGTSETQTFSAEKVGGSSVTLTFNYVDATIAE